MKFVGIDQSYTGFGYCLDGESKKKTFSKAAGGGVDRLWAIRRWFQGWLSDEVVQQDSREVGLIAREGYANGAKFGREMAGELGGVVDLAILDAWGQAPLVVPPTSLKKFVTGKGTAKKNEMLLGVYKQWGVSFSDDNQADAYAIEKFAQAYWRMNELGVSPSLKYQQEALIALRKGKA